MNDLEESKVLVLQTAQGDHIGFTLINPNLGKANGDCVFMIVPKKPELFETPEVDALLSPGNNNSKNSKKTSIPNTQTLAKPNQITENEETEKSINESAIKSILYRTVTQQLANTTYPTKLTELRTENFTIASKIAKSSQLEPSCVAAENIGLGFVIDIPSTPLSDEKQMWTWCSRERPWWLI